MLTDKRYISIPFNEWELKERNRELSILFEMSNFLSSSTNLEHQLSGALSRVLEFFELDSGRIYLEDPGTGHLHLAAHKGIDPTGLEKVSLDGSFSGKAFRTKAFIAQYVSELDDRERAGLLFSKGFRTVICVPLIVQDRAEGVMNLATSKTIRLDQDKIDLLTALGNQIAIAAENTRLYGELESRIRSLKEKKEMIKFFAYSISHDLKSPATGIHGLASRLHEKYGRNLDAKGQECCAQILKTAEYIAALVDKINSYIVTKEAPLNLETVNMKELIGSIRLEFSGILKKRQITWIEPEFLPEIVADRLALCRVFRNFIDNALKYGGEELFRIEIGHKEGKVCHIFSVTDDGAEIRKDEEERIYEVFQRNETSRGTSGSGLGLAIVKETAKRHGGRSWMEPGAGKGKSFFISISRGLHIS